MTQQIGIDIGGTGIKGAPVDLDTGELTADRFRIPTPKKGKPDAVIAVVKQVVDHHGSADGPVGITFPGVVIRGVIQTAANMDKAWIGLPAHEEFGKALGRPVTVVNDADAAGVAEMRFGVGKGRSGVVIMVTLGTGIGCAIFTDGELLPNAELGHLQIDGRDAETMAAGIVREREKLSWPKYAARVERYLNHLDSLLWPDLFIIGGGISKQAAKFLTQIKVRPELVAAQLLNNAGIVGAALQAH